MKLKMESKEIKDLKMGVNSDSNTQHKEDSVENTSETSTNQSITNNSQLNEISTVDIASISREEKVMKVEESGECMTEESDFGSGSQLNSIKSLQNKITLEGNPLAAEVSIEILNIEDSKNHRQNIHYSSDSSDFETDESSDSDEFFKNLHKNVMLPPAKLPTVVKTKGELLSFDLPPVEDLQITENVSNLQKIGKILHIVIAPERNEFLVIVEANGTSNPLDEDSVLFLSSGEPLGKIHDVFGNVNRPNYVVRFNKAEDVDNKCVKQGQDVYYSPSNEEFTHYVLVDDLKQQKGSDASWKDNNEPPDDQIDYSDDEQEKMAKKKRRAKNRKNDRDLDSEEEVVEVSPNKTERRQVNNNQEGAFQARPSRNKFRSPVPGPSRSSPHSYPSPRSFGTTPSPPSTFCPGTSGLQRNAQLSQPCGPTSWNNNRFGGFLQRNVPSPLPLGPVPQSNVPTPTSFGHFTPSRVPSPQSFGTFPQSNVPTPTPVGPFTQSRVPSLSFGPLTPSGAPSPQSFATFTPSGAPSPQSFATFTPSGAPFPQSFATFTLNGAPSPQSFGPFTPSGIPSPQSLGTFPQSNVLTPTPVGPFTQSRVPSQSFGPFTPSGVPSPQSFGTFPQSNVPTTTPFGPFTQSRVPSQSFGPFPQSNVPTPTSFGPFTPNRVSTPQSFGTFSQSSVTSYQSFSASPTSHGFMSPNLASSYTTAAPQQNPSPFMPAPQNNVPLQQQFILQSQQPTGHFLSHPPPNYNTNQSTRTFLPYM